MRYLLLSGCFLFFSLAGSVQAAEYYFGSQGQEVPADGLFTVGVFLDTQGQQINAVQGTVTIPSSLARVQSVEEGNSLISLWIQPPTVVCESACEVSFSGILPGGFTGNDGYLFSLVLAGQGEGALNIDLSNGLALLNDGSGTEAPLAVRPLALTLTPTATTPYYATIDHTPPESFFPVLARDPNVFDGQWFISFSTTDKGSGVDHYEVRETPRVLFRDFFPSWKEVTSPYLLTDQSLRSSVLVRAVDRSGNTMTAILPAPNAPLWYDDDRLWVAFTSLMILFPIVWRIFALWHRKRLPASRD